MNKNNNNKNNNNNNKRFTYRQTTRIPAGISHISCAHLSKYVLEGKYIDQSACSVLKPTCFGLRTQLTFVLQLLR